MLLSTIFFFVVLPILAGVYVYLFVLLPWWLNIPLLIILPAILLIGGFFTIVEWLLKKIFPEKEVVLTKPQKQFDFNRLRNDIQSNMR